MSEIVKFPAKGRSWSEVESDLDRFRSTDVAFNPRNRLMTGINIGEDSIHEVCKQAYMKYFRTNAITLGMEKCFGRMQSDVLSSRRGSSVAASHDILERGRCNSNALERFLPGIPGSPGRPPG